eukprot:1865343-Pleurochrysis_carterae.AAC.4
MRGDFTGLWVEPDSTECKQSAGGRAGHARASGCAHARSSGSRHGGPSTSSGDGERASQSGERSQYLARSAGFCEDE